MVKHTDTARKGTRSSLETTSFLHVRAEIVALFKDLSLPERVAETLIDPRGEYCFLDVLSFVETVEFEDFFL